MDDIILREISLIVIPFIQMYGLYIILHGHLSPGGGFAGGMVLGLSMVLFVLVHGAERTLKKISHDAATVVESLGTAWYIVIGLVGMAKGATFLMNQGAGVNVGTPGQLLSSGLILLITAGVGVKVASTILTLFMALIEEDH